MTIDTILLHAPAGHGHARGGASAWALGASSILGARLTAVVFDADAVTGGQADYRRSPRSEGDTQSLAATDTANGLVGAAKDAGVDVRPVTSRSFAYGLPEVVAEHARLHDLVVTGVDPAGLLSERAMAEHLIFESGRPVVIVPAGFRGPVKLDRIMIAWDNSRVAARALGDSVPLLTRAGEVSLVSVGGERAIDASLHADEVVEALSRRGVKARFERIETAGVRVGETLGQHASRWKADLLVMGAFGHSRLRQFVLGGVTRSMLDRPPLPVLLSH